VNYMKKKLLIGLLLSVLLIAAVFITAVFAKTDIGGAIMAILLVVGVILLITTVKSLARYVLKTK
jgi:c-di-AMP phosphodiesterase-like protein